MVNDFAWSITFLNRAILPIPCSIKLIVWAAQEVQKICGLFSSNSFFAPMLLEVLSVTTCTTFSGPMSSIALSTRSQKKFALSTSSKITRPYPRDFFKDYLTNLFSSNSFLGLIRAISRAKSHRTVAWARNHVGKLRTLDRGRQFFRGPRAGPPTRRLACFRADSTPPNATYAPPSSA